MSHYDQLAEITRSPVVLVNRAVAISFADGPAVAIPLLRELADDPRLRDSHVVPVALAELHERAGDRDAARALFRTALSLVSTDPERHHLERRLAQLDA